METKLLQNANKNFHSPQKAVKVTPFGLIIFQNQIENVLIAHEQQSNPIQEVTGV